MVEMLGWDLRFAQDCVFSSSSTHRIILYTFADGIPFSQHDSQIKSLPQEKQCLATLHLTA